MKCYLIDCLTGLFALDGAGNIVSFEDFNDKVEKKIDFFLGLEKKDIQPEYENLLKELKKSGFDEFFFDNEILAELTSSNLGYQTSITKKSQEFKNFRLNLEDQLKRVGIFKSREELVREYKEISDALIRFRVGRAGEEKDLIIIQTIETIDILKKTISSFTMRLREWYGLYFPELTDTIIDDEILMAQIVSKLGKRENFDEYNLNQYFNLPEKKISLLIEKAINSMGAEIDSSMMQSFADEILSLDDYRIQLEKRLEELMQATAPNLNSVIGSLIGAKLMAKAGSMKKLAFMPASRIQLLGAERALYRFLKTGQKVPKHGIIFQWNFIRGSPVEIRGNIARLVAGKIGIASKIDYFGGDYVGDVLSKEIENKIGEIKSKYQKGQKKRKKVEDLRKVKKKKTKKKRKKGGSSGG